MPLEITRYEIETEKRVAPFRFALASDLHNAPSDHILSAIKDERPDVVFVTGDLMHSVSDGAENGISFLRACARIAPTYLSIGNHDKFEETECLGEIEKSGAVLLDDSFCTCQIPGVTVGGLTFTWEDYDTDFLDRFEKKSGDSFTVLLSHDPSVYDKHLSGRGFDLILSGHAHGGQWRFFGRGVFAPGQGLFPKYTSGLHDGGFIISRGLANRTGVPRFFNDPELVIGTVKRKAAGAQNL